MADIERRGRLILRQTALPTSALLVRDQLEVLETWLRQRWPRLLHPAERVELNIARQLVEELTRRLPRGVTHGVRQDRDDA